MSDNVGQGINAPNAGWTFSGIAKDFDSHVHRSIPYYAESHDLVCKYSDFFVKDQSCVYDFGCSTGALLEKLLKKHGHRSGIRLVGIDTVSEMVEFAKKRTEGDNRCEYVCGDAALLELQPADMIISFYTAQFVAPRSRQRFFDVAYRTLNWGGAFFLFEKVRGPDARFQDYAGQSHVKAR